MTDQNKKLITLEEFNSLIVMSNGSMCDNTPKPNGIECSMCRNELLDTSPNITLTSNPPQKYVHCSQCGYRGYRYT